MTSTLGNSNLRTAGIRAIERRFGKSLMPYQFTERQDTTHGRILRVTDTESGSWVELIWNSHRAKVIAELDGATVR